MPRAPAPTDEMETSTPSTAPVRTVSRAVWRSSNSPTKDQDGCGHKEGGTQRRGDQPTRRGAVHVKTREHQKRQSRHRHAARRQPADDTPIYGSAEAVNQGAPGLRRRGIEEVTPYRRRRMNPEQQNEERGHQRAAAHPGHSHESADGKSGDRVEEIDGMHDIHDRVPKFPLITMGANFRIGSPVGQIPSRSSARALIVSPLRPRRTKNANVIE